MNKYTGRKNEASKCNNERLNKAVNIVEGLEQKYGSVDEEMKSAVLASFSNINSINGCEGLDKSKCQVSSVRVLNKKGNMLSIVATDANGVSKAGNVEEAKVFEIMGITGKEDKETQNIDCKEDR